MANRTLVTVSRRHIPGTSAVGPIVGLTIPWLTLPGLIPTVLEAPFKAIEPGQGTTHAGPDLVPIFEAIPGLLLVTLSQGGHGRGLVIVLHFAAVGPDGQVEDHAVGVAIDLES
jgi:hypothetical protein